MQIAETLGECFSRVFPVEGKVRVGVLSNPLSCGNRNGMRPVLKVLAENPDVPHCQVQTPGDVALALADFARREVDVVAVNGGDGTVQAVLTVLFSQKPFESLPLLAALNSGTTSMIAGDVGTRGVPARALRRILSWASARKRDTLIHQRHALRVQGTAGREAVFGMFFAAAGLHQAIQFWREKIQPLGFRGSLNPAIALCWYLLALARGRRDYLTPVPMSIGLNGKPAERHNCLLLFVSTVKRFPLGLRPYWGTERGPLHYTALTADARHMLRVLPSVLRGRRHRLATPQHGYFSHNVQDVSMTLQNGFFLDGELFMPDSHLGPIVLQDAGQVSFLQV